MTDNEKKLMEQMYEMMCEMKKEMDSIGNKLNESNDRETSVEGKLDDLKSVNKGIQATFEQGFADIHEGLAEIKEVKQIKKNGKQVH